MTITIDDLEYQGVPLADEIPNGSSLGNNNNFQGFYPTAILCPSGWTAAVLTLEASIDGVNWFPFAASSSTQTSLLTSADVAAGEWWQSLLNQFSQAVISGMPNFVRLRSGTTAAPVNQLANRLFTWLLMPNPQRRP